MDWKVFVLVAFLLLPNNVLGLPFELCCQELANSISPSSSFNFQTQQQQQGPTNPDILDSTVDDGQELADQSYTFSINPSAAAAAAATISSSSEHGVSCCNDIQQLISVELANEEKSSEKRSSHSSSTIAVPTISSVSLRRAKRFPIHLDPLYQYRYLARSGQCPTAKDGQPEFYCPTPDKMGNWRCIDDFQLCDGVRHCPNGEDELPVSCLFYRVVETHLHSVSQRLNSDENRQRSPR